MRQPERHCILKLLLMRICLAIKRSLETNIFSAVDFKQTAKYLLRMQSSWKEGTEEIACSGLHKVCYFVLSDSKAKTYLAYLAEYL